MTTDRTNGPPPEAGAGQPLASERAQLEAELADVRNKYLRAMADYQNLRRRSEEERQELARYTLAALVLNYLPVLDDLSRALDSVDADIAGHHWVEGVRMVERKFRGVLEASGVRSIAADGAPFDPVTHEAVSYAPGPEGQVIAVVQHGYAIDGKVIRPARVVVGNGHASAAQDSLHTDIAHDGSSRANER